ncbi:inositol monophosphatase family protein [Kibdelosporangium phytohabitans]|uniref:Inositol-1-monophosphatase n=1 Tax=Kibdelosporangium phytohabitans TaxID=860235 RepID=A0A0N9HU78_9PSEU|nr:inositol monophosphatase family protein [Kibdelosporangium phytohabitans]ALG08744.1 myo-inositol-1-monophosphatase [Kibdelosporangium phytohabitans]MBE1470139.1 myo-inositol-1(or 4)-monophosphatase [Kibdelosporangium phytohabitans]
MADHAELMPIASQAVSMARKIIQQRAPVSVTAKGDRDMVTDVDLAVEDAVRDFLARETPDIRLVGEEHGDTGAPNSTLWWVLDPIDGTANFARGIPLSAVSLALVDGTQAVLAAIDLPFMDTWYTARAGGGAYANGEPMRCSAVTELSDAVVSIGDFAVGGGEAAEKNRVRLALLADLGARVQRVRMIGTAAVDLAWVAQGRLDATVNLSNKPWDTMAGVLLVREAGGLVLDYDGSSHTSESVNTVAVTAGLRDVIMDRLGRARL